MCLNLRGMLLFCGWKGNCLSFLERLNIFIVSYRLCESRCRLPSSSGTADFISTVTQLTEECNEQNLAPYHCFVDLRKVFDTVNWKAVCLILRRIGFSEKFANVITALYLDMIACVNFGWMLSKCFALKNRVYLLTAPSLQYTFLSGCPVLISTPSRVFLYDIKREGMF